MGAVLFLFVAGGVLAAIAIAHANMRRGVSKSGGASRDADSDGGSAGDPVACLCRLDCSIRSFFELGHYTGFLIRSFEPTRAR